MKTNWLNSSFSLVFIKVFFFFFLNPHSRTCSLILERVEGVVGRERCEKHWLVASHMHPNRGPNPQPRYVPWQGIEPFGLWDGAPTNWATLAKTVFINLSEYAVAFMEPRTWLFFKKVMSYQRFQKGNAFSW